MKMLYIRSLVTSLVIAAAAFIAAPAEAQTAAKQPAFVQSQQWADLGNGPFDVIPVEGTGILFTSGGGAGVTGTSAGTTALTLSGTPAVAPCVGCVITCAPTNTAACTIPAATTVTAFNGTTGVTTSASTTVTAASLVWGAACPASTAANVPGASPVGNTALSPPLQLRASGGTGGYPIYSTARLCLYGQQAGLTMIYFPIGAH